MKRPWQIWTLPVLCLAVVVPAMGYLTLKALELDRAEALARRQAELEEDISLALWRMDTALAPLVAQEAARPHFVYQPFYPAAGGKAAKGKTSLRVPSPLLMQPSEHVLLNFECSADGMLSSPQCPPADLQQWAIDNGTNVENIRASAERLARLSSRIGRDELLAMLPRRQLPAGDVQPSPWIGNVDQFTQNSEQGMNLNPGFQELDEPRQGASQRSAPGPQQGRQQAQSVQPMQLEQPAQQQARAPQQIVNQRGRGSAAMRGGVEWWRRNRAIQKYAQNTMEQQEANYYKIPPLPTLVNEGLTRPIWIGSELLLARRVANGSEVLIQGCWLDWPKIKRLLMQEIADLLPEADLLPVSTQNNVPPGRMLATLPVQLVVPVPIAVAAPLSPIRISLWIAWGCLLLAAVAVACLLHGVIALSERRGAFVSAVTHELRTPLTTFRMYAEMLAEGMTTSAQQRQHYVETLRVEADRLAHLVENVLSYAQLERGRRGRQREDVTLGELVDRARGRLADRAGQAEMQLIVDAGQQVRGQTVHTDPTAVEQILFNLVDNACKYAAVAEDRRIHLQLETTGREARLRVKDHGPGISAAQARRLFRPFSKSVHEAASTAPGVGLGLALCRRLACDLGGRLELEDTGNNGASFMLTLPRSC